MYLTSPKAHEKDKVYREFWLKMGEEADRLLQQGKIDLVSWRDTQRHVFQALKPRDTARMTGIGNEP